MGNSAALEASRKRSYEDANQFFQDVRRQKLAPVYDEQMAQRLALVQQFLPQIHAQHVPMDAYAQSSMVAVGGGGGGGGGGGPMTSSMGNMGGMGRVPPGHHHYALPALRTKVDLLEVDAFLQQLSTAVYESPNNAAAAGVQHPAHYAHANVNTYRQSNSPPSVHHGSPTSAAMAAAQSASSHGTPALTPPTSHSSFGGSPLSQASMSMYPSLPAVSSMGEASGYPAAVSGAPTSTLGSQFDADGRRRYSGGVLQAGAPDDMDTSSDKTSRPASSEGDDLAKKVENIQVSSSLIDPALGGVASPSGESAAEDADSQWCENLRTFEILRQWVKDRLDNREYDSGEDEDMKDISHDDEAPEATDAEKLYPVLQALTSDA
jgi:hypothetical protein